MNQRVEEPNDEDLVRIEAQRDWVRGHFAPDAKQKYSLLQEKLRLLQTIIDAGWIELPLTMISKRIERGETGDVADLFKGVAEQAREIAGRVGFSRH